MLLAWVSDKQLEFLTLIHMLILDDRLELLPESDEQR